MNMQARTQPGARSVQEMPRDESGRLYMNVTWGRNSSVERSRPDVWLALFFFVVGVLISPIDFAVGAVVGIPAFSYLVASARSV